MGKHDLATRPTLKVYRKKKRTISNTLLCLTLVTETATELTGVLARSVHLKPVLHKALHSKKDPIPAGAS